MTYKIFRHPSKKLAFNNICSSCGKPLRRNAQNKVGYICRKCGPRTGNCYENNSCCSCCPFEMECTMRVQLGLWIRCETPDIADLERLKLSGGLNDERVLRAVDEALEFRGNRKILEEAIIQGAPKIYQGIIKGTEGQMSIGLRIKSEL